MTTSSTQASAGRLLTEDEKAQVRAELREMNTAALAARTRSGEQIGLHPRVAALRAEKEG